jgi:hypothetical protein
VSTGRSSTDLLPPGALPARKSTRRRLAEARRDVADLGPLFSFRAATLRGRSRAVARHGFAVVGILTVLAGWLPAYLPEGAARRTDVLSVLPSALVGVLAIALVSAAASGGGRELVPHDQAAPYPIAPITDHLGALAMAPLNIAWLFQAWMLLAATAYVAGARPGLLLSQLMVVVWLVTATCIAQVAGWGVEWVRRGVRGPFFTRVIVTLAVLVGAFVVAGHRLVPLLQGSPTTNIVIAMLQGSNGVTPFYVQVLGSLLVLAFMGLMAGAYLAAAVARRPPHDELKLESSTHRPRPDPTSDLVAMMRTDRVGIWRSVPLRRGLAVLAVMPGLVAIAGDLQWDMLTILPGLVTSGGALLFGVNSWCLDGRGALWRDSLPVQPRLAFVSRALVLVEVLLLATAATVVMAALRAGLPSVDELTAVGCAAVVVTVQVVSASLRWSVRRPFSVDLRSARATPAPPLVMVAYSARLAFTTTLVGITFSVLAHLPWGWSVLLSVPLVLLSGWRLSRTAGAWADPGTRARVVATVAS